MPNSIPDSERSLGDVYTKNEKVLVDTVPYKTHRQPHKNSKITYTQNEKILGVGKEREGGEPAETIDPRPNRAAGTPQQYTPSGTEKRTNSGQCVRPSWRTTGGGSSCELRPAGAQTPRGLCSLEPFVAPYEAKCFIMKP